MEKKFFTRNTYDSILYESEHFSVVPSLGSLVEGWVLIIPKEETLNISLLEVTLQNELAQLIQEIESFQRSLFGDTVIFEHGPANKCSKTGCGVDYAHLHMVPFKKNLIDGIRKFLGLNYNWVEIEGISNISKYNKDCLDYLYYRSTDNRHYITFYKEFPSQIFRQVIAHFENIPDRYNWREYPENHNILKTMAEFNKIKVSHEW